MSGFTKGDWYISDEDCDAVYSSSSTARICCMDKFNSDFEANAHLIAAAPKMYEALSKLLEPYGTEDFSHDEIEQILAKARGEV